MHVIHTVWPYLALMLLVAGLFPAVERRFGWKVFSVLPPIVLTYLFVTALAVSGLWQVNEEIRAAQSMLVAHLVPALLFLLMINCDLRAIWRLGPRVLGVFACTSLSLFVAFVGTFLIYRHWLPGDDWQPLAALSGSWVGGSANMIAVKQAIGMSDAHLAMSLLTDALGYSMWVVVLFSVARLAPAFNRWTRAASSGDIPLAPVKTKAPTTYDSVLLWLGMALSAAALSGWLANWLPASGMISATTWTILLATGLGLVVAHTPLAEFPGAGTISSAMLISVVAVLASQSNFQGIAAAPLYLLCGITIIAIHAVLLVGFAKLFRFDLYLCGISSLAHIGGVAATPILAASYSAALVPVGILLALLGYILGTGYGLVVAMVLSALAGP
ncbi:hypothetical protein RHOFW510R12_06390 [Rhodanobacter sp. FW510-R12]|uniref:DUF819 family protein n=1 Tax=unclassified Rhodanobacter TaxID=2621553 RepID=UPI0007AA1884|nr:MULTISPECIES: DUF819 family protein [unclassified Rhodanobacter]KZC17763.1 hypothetical protein RHOFW104R8_09730 [Rhodanobacter sp. FW104-R8]KZC28025.1 hypothetical protein RhoFW510T8_12925 [Rhodanobacter sp. FW510-T8]KZC33192.1 hypothetical protein RhoFW510R10_09005 [Rhodanobacter sp. FW510-R10]